MPRKKTDTEKCKHSHSKERKKKILPIEPRLCVWFKRCNIGFFLRFFFQVCYFVRATKGRAPWSKTQTLRLTNSYRLQYNHRTYNNIARSIVVATYQFAKQRQWYQFNRKIKSAANIMYLKSTIKWNAAAVVVVFFCSSLFSFNNSLLVDIVVGFLWACYGYRKSIYIFIVHIQSNGNRQMKGNFCGCLWMGFEMLSLYFTYNGRRWFSFRVFPLVFFLLLLLSVVLDSSVSIHCLMIAL